MGLYILDLSKTLFHYNYVNKKYGPKAKLGFTVTDLLCYEITTKDAYADFWADKHKFNNSDYPMESPFFLFNKIRNSSGNSRMKPLACPSRNLLGSKVRCIVTLKTMAKTKRPAKGLRKMSSKRISLMKTTEILFSGVNNSCTKYGI